MNYRIALGLAAASLAFAALDCRAQDAWTGPDKKKHFAVSLVVGLATRQLAPHNELAAFGVALVPGLLKELVDAGQRGTNVSAKDLVADALGAYAGVKLGGLVIAPADGGARVTYLKEF